MCAYYNNTENSSEPTTFPRARTFLVFFPVLFDLYLLFIFPLCITQTIAMALVNFTSPVLMWARLTILIPCLKLFHRFILLREEPLGCSAWQRMLSKFCLLWGKSLIFCQFIVEAELMAAPQIALALLFAVHEALLPSALPSQSSQCIEVTSLCLSPLLD